MRHWANTILLDSPLTAYAVWFQQKNITVWNFFDEILWNILGSYCEFLISGGDAIELGTLG